MKKNILIIGTGGHARSCIDVIESTNQYRVFGLIAKSKSEKNNLQNYKIVGLEKDLNFLFKKVKYALIAFGGIKKTFSREALFKKLKKIGYILPIIQSKYSYVSKNSKVSEGTIIMNGSFVNFGSKIGKNCIINSKAIIEHDVIVGDNSQISPGVILCGSTSIGDNSFIGAGSVIKENIKVSSSCIVGANSYLDKNLSEKNVYIIKGQKIFKKNEIR